MTLSKINPRLMEARLAAIASLTPYKTFHQLSGYYPSEFPFKTDRDVISLDQPRSWSEFVRIKETLLLLSLDLSHEPIPRISTQSSGKSKPERFAIEDL